LGLSNFQSYSHAWAQKRPTPRTGQVRAFAHTFREAAPNGGFGVWWFCPPNPAHQRVTQAVETVEKVSFQKLFLKSGTETLKSIWFLVFHTTFLATFWQFFSLLWEIFLNIFRTRGFSTVSLGSPSE
jgi:hypothetical protein